MKIFFNSIKTIFCIFLSLLHLAGLVSLYNYICTYNMRLWTKLKYSPTYFFYYFCGLSFSRGGRAVWSLQLYIVFRKIIIIIIIVCYVMMTKLTLKTHKNLNFNNIHDDNYYCMKMFHKTLQKLNHEMNLDDIFAPSFVATGHIFYGMLCTAYLNTACIQRTARRA